MTHSQPYIKHKSPVIMGLTQFEWQNFLDILIKTNDLQLEFMESEIRKEKVKRDK